MKAGRSTEIGTEQDFVPGVEGQRIGPKGQREFVNVRKRPGPQVSILDVVDEGRALDRDRDGTGFRPRRRRSADRTEGPARIRQRSEETWSTGLDPRCS